jgi:hypothetical protein
MIAPLESKHMKTLNLHGAAAFLHMHPEEVRTRAKRGIIPGAKIGRCWVFIDTDADFIRSQYPVRRQALPANRATLQSADWMRPTQKEYEELLKPAPRGGRKSSATK